MSVVPDSVELPRVDPGDKSMEELVALCKRRGFVYPASEIYGGFNGFWDYGPLGTQLKNNIRDWWWRNLVACPPIGPDGEPVSIVGLDSAIIQHPRTWEASGHVATFADPMVDCTETQRRYRQDQLEVLTVDGRGRWAFPENQLDAIAKKLKKAGVGRADGTVVNLTEIPVEQYDQIIGPDATRPGTLTEPRQFNLMLGTDVGAVHPVKAFLRPETAQGIFLNYRNVLDTMRVKVPFGIAQVGKSFRNEVTPRNFIFRSREFEQMEMEWFCAPDEAATWYDFWKHQRMGWWESLGIDKANLRFRDHGDDELSHYSKMCVDVEYRYPFTAPNFGELEGIAHRGCFDLTQHQTFAKQKMEYFDQERQLAAREQGLPKEQVDAVSKYVPNVIEPASGLTRAVLVLLCEGFTPTPDRSGSKFILRFKPRFAPVKAGIFPLVNKDGMPEVARRLYLGLRERFTCEYDAKQSIGKRYARMDEIGTPTCVTVDGDSLADQTVTVRDRDTLAQERIHIDQVERYLADKQAG